MLSIALSCSIPQKTVIYLLKIKIFKAFFGFTSHFVLYQQVVQPYYLLIDDTVYDFNTVQLDQVLYNVYTLYTLCMYTSTIDTKTSTKITHIV